MSLITAGYLTVDFFIQYFKVKGTDPISKQMYWHHFFGLTSILLSAFGGYGMVGTVPVMLLVEVSTVFLNYRSMFDKHEYGQFIP